MWPREPLPLWVGQSTCSGIRDKRKHPGSGRCEVPTAFVTEEGRALVAEIVSGHASYAEHRGLYLTGEEQKEFSGQLKIQDHVGPGRGPALNDE